MKVEDTLFTKKISVRTKDIYSTVNEVVSIISNFGDIREKKNIYETDGPRKRIERVFDIIEEVDKHYKAEIHFQLAGESNGSGLLDITISGITQTNLEKGAGIASSAFSDFYAKNFLPTAKHGMEKKIKSMANEIEKGVRKLEKENLI